MRFYWTEKSYDVDLGYETNTRPFPPHVSSKLAIEAHEAMCIIEVPERSITTTEHDDSNTDNQWLITWRQFKFPVFCYFISSDKIHGFKNDFNFLMSEKEILWFAKIWKSFNYSSLMIMNILDRSQEQHSILENTTSF